MALLTVPEGQPLGRLRGHAEQHQGAACSRVGDVLCREAGVEGTEVTLKEVLLVLGGHVGLLVHGLQEDGYPRPPGTEERREDRTRQARGQADPHPSRDFIQGGGGSAPQRKGWGGFLSHQCGETRSRAHVLRRMGTVDVELKSPNIHPLPWHLFPLKFT